MVGVPPPKVKFKPVAVVAGVAVPNVNAPDAGVVDPNSVVATEKPAGLYNKKKIYLTFISYS